MPVYDWERGGVILETVLVSGCEFEAHLPLLRDHRQYSVDAILGSVIDIAVSGDELTGTVEFGRDLDEETEAIWRRVAQGHLRRGSIGYRYGRGDYTDIPAGETRTIAGRSFTAPADRRLRVVTRWTLVEFSMVVIPADPRAQLRGETEDDPGTPPGSGQSGAASHDPAPANTPPSRSASPVNNLLKFLRGLGLSADITEVAAAVTWARANLNADQLAEMQTVAAREQITLPAASDDQDPPPAPAPARNTPAPQPGSGQADPDAAVRAERERVRRIRELAGDDVNPELVTRACDEGWDVARASQEFLTAVRQGRSGPVPATPPAGHTGGGAPTRESLIVGVLARHGIEPGHQSLQSLGARTMLGTRGVNADFVCRADSSGLQQAEQRAIQEGYRYAGMSFADLARECLRLDGQRAPYDQDEMFERALTTANFSAVLGALVNALVLVHYEQYPDTTTIWTRRNLNVPDFRENQRFRNTAAGRLKKMGKNQHEADHVDVGAPVVESYVIERTAGKVVIDERVLINDSLDVLDDTPQLIGESARAMISDAVYGHLVANGNMADNKALFHVDRDNLNATSALAAGTLEAGRAKMATQKENGRTLGISPQYLIVPEALDFTARQLVNSVELRDNAADANYGTSNPHRGRFQVVAEARLDNGGFNPLTEADFSASTSSWYLAAGQNRHTIEVGFRQGTNGMPRIRRKVLDGGAWGILFDILLDFGVKALSPAGLQKNTA